MNFEIKSKNQFKTYLKNFLFLIGFLLLITPLFLNNQYEVLSFFGLIIMIIGLFFSLFNSKESLIISQNYIKFESKSIIKEFNKSIEIPFDTIQNVNFFKRQFLNFGGRSIISPKLYFENRIILILENNKREAIIQVGKLADFKKAYEIIKNRVNKSTTTPPAQYELQ
ncbi:hypothetical protein [Yeosuana marina]|uniref:hypothetical protein n=1 Tax=Yeosuana marina TaxID=1565536 RepID=UPI0030C8C908